ncbi:MAG TPA: ATP-binding protein [Kofleriaceae bacterium]
MRATPSLVAAKAYPDPASHLFDYLERAAWLLAETRPHVDTILARDAQIEAREAITDVPLPLTGLKTRARLDLPEMHVLVLAAIPGLDVTLGDQLFEQIASSAPTVQELITILSFSMEDEGVLLAAFAPDAPLRALGLVTLGAERNSLLHRTVQVDDRMVAFLRGDDTLDPALRDVAALEIAAPTTVDDQTVESLRALIGTPGPILVDGHARVGKTATVVAAIASVGRRALVGNMELVLAEPEPAAVLYRLRREALLLDATLVLRCADLELAPAMSRRLVAYAQDSRAILTLRNAEAMARELLGPRRVTVPMPSVLEQQRIWRQSLASANLPATTVWTRYPLPPGDIVQAAAAARAQCEVEQRPITDADLLAAARARLCHRLGDVADIVSTTLSWDDLVLREETATRVHEIVAAVKHRDQVMDDWGFSTKLPYGRALSALFSGPPGTGKTMVASLIGKELGLEIFRVDLSKVVSKYVGETEKNLGRVFEEASRSRAVILFDEADSLFAKRTEVKSSNDRYANLEVNFLLQRLESHDGIVILTTNAASSIDTAFLRRIRYRVEFPEPDEHERKRLWQAMLPRSAPVAKDVDFAELGRRYRLTGGHIKNAVVRAAYMTAAEGKPQITQEALVRAAMLEWTELGNLPGL